MGPPPIRTRRITLTLPRLCWLLPGLLLLTGGAFLCRMGYLNYAQCRAFAKGPTADAVITDCHIETSSGKKGPRYSVVVTYAYSVNGAAFTGSRLFLDRMSTRSLPEAEAVMARFPTGARVPAYYDASDPGSSVLDPRLTRELLLPPFLGTGLVLLAGSFLSSLKHWFFKAGLPINVRRVESGYVIEPSEPYWRFVGGAVALVLLFCGATIGGLFAPVHTADPSPGVFLAAYALAPLAVVGFELRSKASLRAARQCIVIDLASDRLLLRSASTRKPPKLDVAISEIVGIGSKFVQQYRSSSDPNGRYAHYTPRIEYFEQGRVRATMSLDDFQFLRKDTDELCQWLRFILLLEAQPSHAQDTLA